MTMVVPVLKYAYNSKSSASDDALTNALVATQAMSLLDAVVRCAFATVMLPSQYTARMQSAAAPVVKDAVALTRYTPLLAAVILSLLWLTVVFLYWPSAVKAVTLLRSVTALRLRRSR